MSTVWSRTLKVGILLLLLGSLVYHLSTDDIVGQLWRGELYLPVSIGWAKLILAILLMPVNWMWEVLKWRYLMQRLTRVSLLQAIKAVLAGVAFAIFTPNRIGEYAGRVIVLKNAYRLKGLVLTLLNSFAQIIVTLSAGTIGLLTIMREVVSLPQNEWVMLMGVISVVGLSVYGGMPFWVRWLEDHFPGKQRYRWFRLLMVMRKVDQKALWLVFIWSILRYLTYTLQFALVVAAFSGIDWYSALPAITAMFMLQMGIPLPAMFEIGVRGSLAANLLIPLGVTATSALLASSLIWVVNLMVPALVGGIIIWNIRLNRK